VDGPASGGPAITRNSFGAGAAWYVSTKLDGAGIEAARDFDGVESITRSSATDDFRFLINHTDVDQVVEATGTELITDTPVDGTVLVPAGLTRVVRTPR